MDTADILLDAYGRIREIVHYVVEGLDSDDLAYRVDPDANSIAWLVWHLTRTQDDHVAEIAGRPQTWVGEGWAERFGMDPDPNDTGFGHTSEQVAAVRPPEPVLLTGYHDAVWRHTIEYLGTISPEELARIIDYSWDPPVSVGVRLVSVISDNLQHAGQAAYVRGVLERTR